METRLGVTGMTVDGIFFTEEAIEGVPTLGSISIAISRQNSNLDEVKTAMARKAKAKGASAVVRFTYGQRRHSVLQYLNPFRWDTESWYGEGLLVRLPGALP